MSAALERAEIEASMARHREELRSALADVKAGAAAAIAPAEVVRRRPYLFLAAAGAVGLWLAQRSAR